MVTSFPRLAWTLVPCALVAACASAPDGDGAADALPEAREAGAVLDLPDAPVVPATAGVRRLPAAELRRSLVDLLGVDASDRVPLPQDAASAGFRNQADVLAVTPWWFEQVEALVRAAVEEALAAPPEDPRVDEVLAPLPIGVEVGLRDDELGREVSMGAAWRAALEVDEGGRHALGAKVWVGGPVTGPPRAVLRVDGAALAELRVTARAPDPAEVLAGEAWLEPGHHLVEVAFTPVIDGVIVSSAARVVVEQVRVSGPQVDADRRLELVPCALDELPESCTTRALAAFVPRAWRRPVTDDELAPLEALAASARADGDTPWQALEEAFVAALLHPRFLFRVEAGQGRPADGHEVAARLASALWASVPDAALTEAAASGALDRADGVRAQVARMLDDPRADVLTDAFLGAWLGAEGLDVVQPDLEVFPDFDGALRQAMDAELRAFLATFVAGRRPLDELLTGTVREITPRLAEHYAAAATSGLVDLERLGRPGVLGTAALQTALAAPRRTSPTRRGAYVLGVLRCEPPDPPPTVVPALEGAATVADAVRAHAENPACAACHASMDPLGLALEAFDGIGRRRPGVVAEAELEDGTTLRGLQGLVDWLGADDTFGRCATRKLATYLLGRVPGAQDGPLVDAVHAAAMADDGSLEAMLTAWFTRPELLPGEAP